MWPEPPFPAQWYVSVGMYVLEKAPMGWLCACLAHMVMMPCGFVCLLCGRGTVRKSLSIDPVLEEPGIEVEYSGAIHCKCKLLLLQSPLISR